MTKRRSARTASAAATSSPPTPVFDYRRLAGLVRLGDQRALDRAYQMTFNTEVGRLVLAHHLMESGVGNPISTVGRSEGDLHYLIGQHNAALALAAKAGIDQAAIVVAALSGNLEENQDAPAQQEPPADVAAFEPDPDDGF